MSAGSNNIVIRIDDQVAGTIAPKIREIGQAAIDASNSIGFLQGALSTLNNPITNLQNSLNKLNPSAQNAAGGTDRLTGSIAQLLARVVGAEAGVGMLGGAFGRVGVAAGLAGPLIVAALAAAAIAGAILLYEKFEAAARKLIEAQTGLNEHTAAQNTSFLVLRETLIGLTEGPLAKYQAELNDLSRKSISDDISKIDKVLDAQKSKWADLISLVERYGAVLVAPGAVSQVGQKFDIQDAKDFLSANKEARSELDAQGQGLKGLQNDLVATGNKLIDLNKIEQQESGRTLENTEVARKAIQQHYADLLQEQKNFNEEKKIKEVQAAGESLSQQRKAAQDELAQFNEEINSLRANADGVVKPQDILKERQDQLSQFTLEHPDAIKPDTLKSPSPNNEVYRTLEKDVANATQSIERQNRALQELVDKNRAAQESTVALTEAQRLQADHDKNVAKVEKLAPGNDNNADTVAQLDAINQATEKNSGFIKEAKKLYAEVNEPLKQYNDGLRANQFLLVSGTESFSRFTANLATITARYRESTIAGYDFQLSIKQQTSLFGIYGENLKVVSQVEAQRRDAAQKGLPYTQQEIVALTQQITLFERQKVVNAEVAKLYSENAGVVEQLTIKQEALNEAFAKGIINHEKYVKDSQDVAVALAKIRLNSDETATAMNQLVVVLAKMGSQGKSTALQLTDIYSQLGTNIETGLGNALASATGRAETLGQALRKMGQNVLQALISAMAQLAIKLLVNITLATILDALTGGGAGAAGAGSGGLTPSLDGGIPTYVGSKDGGIIGADTGGFLTGPGTGRSDSILARLSNGEYIVNAQATALNRNLLDQINSGASTVKTNGTVSNGSTSSGNGTMHVHVEHDGSTAIEVRQTADDRIRIIARSEARNAVSEHAPSIIAADISNPNSRTSKALNQNINAARRR